MNSTNPKSPRLRGGFALISTLLLLMLIVVIAMGTLSLSSIGLRSSGQDSAKVRAQANARMALMLAIGELQKQMGPDQRISAKSEILAPDPSTIRNRHWTGAWNSWKAGEGEYSQHSTIGERVVAGFTDEMAPSYQPNRSDYFRKWLVSLNEAESTSITSPIDLNLQAADMPLESHDAVFLVGKGSLGDEDAVKPDYVSARLIDIKDPDSLEASGRYGWWVGDESQKARVMDDSYAPPDKLDKLTRTDKIHRTQAAASTGTKNIQGLEEITDDTQLAALPSFASIDLLAGAEKLTAQRNFHHVTPHSYQVLSDVREGGLKRDLSTLLERPISLSETGNEFMLYRFETAGEADAEGEARVPIQDLAAYYQLYYNDPAWGAGRRGGVSYDASKKSFEIKTPDYGTPATREKYLRQYTSLYTSPVPVRIQYILAMGAAPITDAEKTRFSITTDTHKLLLAVVPVLSLWNPNNIPMVIERGNRMMFRLNAPPFGLRWSKYRSEGGAPITDDYINLNYALGGSGGLSNGRANRYLPYIMQFKFAESEKITFEPGEVKIFSYPSTAGTTLASGNDGTFIPAASVYEPQNKWDPFSFFLCNNSAGGFRIPGHAYSFNGSDQRRLIFKAADRIDVEVAVEGRAGVRREDQEGLQIARMNEVYGGAFNFYLAGYNHSVAANKETQHFRNYQFMSRFGGGSGVGSVLGSTSRFSGQLMQQGFPDQKDTINFEPANAMPGSKLIAAAANGETNAFLVFSMMAGCETNAENVGGYGAGRRTASRPFLHGATIAAPLVDSAAKEDLYDTGWEWQVDKINSIEEAVQMEPGTGNSYFGGGYTVEAGTTRVVQQNLPVIPPISIASLSSAHLGGFSMANQPTVALADQNVEVILTARSGRPDYLRSADATKDFKCVTATGASGLDPHIMQAIGNSYANPNIPSNVAFKNFTLNMNVDSPTGLVRPYVDHSYLANKALWDEFFFSSMTPQAASTVTFFEQNRTLTQVATEFFDDNKPLPNRRIAPYKNNLHADKLTYLLAQKDLYQDGLADQIAAHLMVEGAFNVNSTSVEAWKVFLSSLKGKPIAYVKDGVVSEQVLQGVPASAGNIGNAPLVKSANITGINKPEDQWKSAGRELTDAEIEGLAKAMVVQVKLRGPFLSMSDFVNRRLANNTPMALKGALQAALDDPSVSINANFRTNDRILDAETAAIPFAYPDAAKGPIAYGSTAYVDQADVLGHFAEQLAPRGDTFVIRTYGDALDKNGKVTARAWCEAVVQRVPEYVNSADDPHLKQADSTLSDSSKQFGRKIQITSFRWLSPKEV